MARKGASLLAELKQEVKKINDSDLSFAIVEDDTRTFKPLTAQQEAFVRGIVDEGLSVRAAGMKAGFANPHESIKAASIQRALEVRRQEYAAASRISKKRVIDGMMEAIDAAKLAGEPGTMVAGWKEIARLCGHYEPQKTEVNISVNGQVMMQQMATLSDEELIRMASEEVTDVEPIDGDH